MTKVAVSSMKTGIVGLPNVGKSTLFNALTGAASAQAANYPFCTIDPNSGEVLVPDERIDKIASIAASQQKIPARTTFIDIAGLVGGASKGQGLGNQFLATIREVDAIVHVVRCFDDRDIIHVADRINPLNDIEIIETELILADLESVERQREKLVRRIRGGDSEAVEQDKLLQAALQAFEANQPASKAEITDASLSTWRRLGLLTTKPVLYVCNVDETSAACGNAYSNTVAEFAQQRGDPCVICSAAFEEQLIGLEPDEAQEFLVSIGCQESGLKRVISAAYERLELHTFFTAGPKESRAWTIPKGTTAIDAGGRIHGDFRRGFIRAETISYEDFILYNGETGAREAGRLRTEGRDYIVENGDILHFLFNV